jgi:hypothetical protein
MVTDHDQTSGQRADERDRIADQRDHLAEEREQRGVDRERAADEQHERIKRFAASVHVSLDDTVKEAEEAIERARARPAERAARLDRSEGCPSASSGDCQA